MGPSRARLLLFAITLNVSVSAKVDLSISGDPGIRCREAAQQNIQTCTYTFRDPARLGTELPLACVLRSTGKSRQIADYNMKFGLNTTLGRLRSPLFSETMYNTIRLTETNGAIKCEASNVNGGNTFVTDLRYYYVPAKLNPSSESPAAASSHWWTSDAPEAGARTPKAGLNTVAGKFERWLALTLSGLLIFLLVVLLGACAKFRKRRAAPAQRHAAEMARDVMLKVVSIDTEADDVLSPEGNLQIPKVRIEKRKLSDIVEEFPRVDCSSEYVMRVDASWEIDRQRLTLGRVLGEGEFGRVVQGYYRKETKNGVIVTTTVAVKMLKEGHSDADLLALVSESELMKKVGRHENILALLGCCARGGPFCVVVEFAANGCLRDYLRTHKPGLVTSTERQPLTHEDLVQFALQVAAGMAYLAARGCVHRDLAARNVLVSRRRVLKVADFGLARDVRARGAGAGAQHYYRKRGAGKLPVRWMAPESIATNYYTTKSDVWSFGVLLWEMMTYGSTPYRDVSASGLYDRLREGQRLPRPSGCSEQVHQLMTHCGAFDPDERPTFAELRETLAAIVSHTDITP